MSDLTREKLAELQWLQDEHLKAMGFHDVTESWLGLARAAVKALPALLDAAELLAIVRDQITRRGALCPMCSTGGVRWTVGLVCQLCGTDYSRPRNPSQDAQKRP